MSIRVLLVDDERRARETLRHCLALAKHDFEIREAANGMEAVALIRDFQPQLVFLDIQMPKLTGFDVLRQVEPFDFQVVFQTAHDEFAVQAFEASACDYLLKPFTEERFAKALQRALKGLARSPNPAFFEGLQQALAGKHRYQEQLLIPVGDKDKVFPVQDIISLTSADHETTLTHAGGEYWHNRSLSQLERALDPERFIRVHRNAIINRAQIKTIAWGRPIVITMVNGAEFAVAKERAAAFRRIMLK